MGYTAMFAIMVYRLLCRPSGHNFLGSECSDVSYQGWMRPQQAPSAFCWRIHVCVIENLCTYVCVNINICLYTYRKKDRYIDRSGLVSLVSGLGLSARIVGGNVGQTLFCCMHCNM